MIVIMGVYPLPFLKAMEPSVKALVARMQAHTEHAEAATPPTRVAARTDEAR
jgi:NADH:ubiquinone oxidoreductase subunit 4 (subunit M)